MNATIKFLIFLVIVIIASSIAFLVPAFAEMEITGTVAITLASTIMLIGAVVYFVSSLKAFKRGLKMAYYLLASGILIYSFILLQFFVILFTGIEDVVVRNALFLIPFGSASFLAYLGMHKFARLLEVKSIATSFIFVVSIAAVAAILATFLPVSPRLLELGVDEATLDIIASVLMWSVVFAVNAAAVALRVREAISPTYRPAMIWVSAAFFMMAVSALHELVVKTYFFDSAYVVAEFSLWPFLFTSGVFLRAGLAFRATHVSALQLSENATYTEVISATASLVSKPAAVDAELDKFRVLTSTIADPRKLSVQDKTALRQVYLYLEEYLVTREPLSKFSRDVLRENLPKEFAAGLGKQISSDVFRAQSSKVTRI